MNELFVALIIAAVVAGVALTGQCLRPEAGEAEEAVAWSVRGR